MLARTRAKQSRSRNARSVILQSGLRTGRIAISKTDAIGDFVLSTAFLKFFQRYAPDAEVTLICREPVGILARDQFPDWRVVELPRAGRPLRDILGVSGTRIRRELAALGPFDVLIDLRSLRDMRDTVITTWIPAQFKLALENQNSVEWSRLTNEAAYYDQLVAPSVSEDRSVSREIQFYRTLAGFLGAGAQPQAATLLPKLDVSLKASKELEVWAEANLPLDLNTEFLLVSPGSLRRIKEYPADYLAEALRDVLEKRPIPLLLAGSVEDKRTTHQLKEALGMCSDVFDIAGELSLPQHVALVNRATAVVSMDSATAHIAGALGIPAVILLGGGQYGTFGPWGESPKFHWLTNPLSCFGCNWLCIYERPICIHNISSQRVASHILQVCSIDSTCLQ